MADQISGRTAGGTFAGAGRQPDGQETQERQRIEESAVNVGPTERAVSLAAGAIVTGLGIARRSLPGFLTAAAGGALIFRGATGRCPLYRSLGVSTAAEGGTDRRRRIARHGIRVEQAFLINRSPEELYRYWRNLEN